MSSKEGPFQLGPELETKSIKGLQMDQEKGSKRRKVTHPWRLRLLLLLGSICSFFGLWEAFLVARNEVVEVELGGVEEMVLMDLEIFKEMRGIEMELCMEAWRWSFLTPTKDISCLLYRPKKGCKGGGKGEQNSPTKYPPDKDLFWGILPNSCKGNSARSPAGLVLLLQVAGRPHPYAGRLGVKRVNHIFWPATNW